MEDCNFTVYDEQDTRPPRQKPPTGCILAVFGAAALFVWLVMHALVPTDWRIFTKKRIEQLEAEYHMNLRDADPERYWIPSIAQDTRDCFVFYVSDYHAFMEQCFFGKIIQSEETPDGYSAVYKCLAYQDGSLNLRIEFTAEDGRYKADLVSYTE